MKTILEVNMSAPGGPKVTVDGRPPPAAIRPVRARTGTLATSLDDSGSHHCARGRGEIVRGEGVLFLKLFNRVVDELGEAFLRRGVYVEVEYRSSFLTRLSDGFWSACKIERNGVPATRAGLLDSLLAGGKALVRLSLA